MVPCTSERLRVSRLLEKIICSTVWPERLAKLTEEVIDVDLAYEKSPLLGPRAEITQLPGPLLQEALPDQPHPTGLSALLLCPPRGPTASAPICTLTHRARGALPQPSLQQGFPRVEVPPQGAH